MEKVGLTMMTTSPKSNSLLLYCGQRSSPLTNLAARDANPVGRRRSFCLRNTRFCLYTFSSSRFTIRASATRAQQNPTPVAVKLASDKVLVRMEVAPFASIASSTSQETSSVGVNPNLSVPPPPSYVGSPLFWVGVGVGLSAIFSWVAARLKKYAMQQAFKTMMGQMGPQSNQFSNAGFPPGSPYSQSNQFNTAGFSPGSPYPFSMPSTLEYASPATSSPPASQSPKTVDIPATKVEHATKEEAVPTAMKDVVEVKSEQKKVAFVDVSPEETTLKSPYEYESFKEVSKNGAASRPGDTASEVVPPAGQSKPALSVEALEKMMEDPTVQKMVYPYLPEEMRNPTTFKWMLQNPQYRQQLEDMLKNMGGSGEWDNRMMDSLKNFDLNSPQVKQQFEEIGLTPEEVISKIMANPDIAMAFQNPRIQTAIMDVSQNPMSIAKYQNDKEVMDVFNKISALFPGATGSP